MTFDTLGSRQKEYEKNYEYSITKRLPVIIRVNGRSFSRLTKKLERPFCPDFTRVMANTMLYTIIEMQGTVIGYQQSDEITFVLRNDQTLDSESWYQNRIQKMVSVAASAATKGFEKALKAVNPDLDLVGDALFDARAFSLPTLTEVVNNLIWRQQECIRESISSAAHCELLDMYDKKTALKLVNKKPSSEKKDILFQHCGIDFEEYYPAAFRRGIVAAKVPTIIPTKEGSVTRNKWMLNLDVPNFVEDKDFLFNILLNGHDIFRVTSLPPK